MHNSFIVPFMLKIIFRQVFPNKITKMLHLDHLQLKLAKKAKIAKTEKFNFKNYVTEKLE